MPRTIDHRCSETKRETPPPEAGRLYMAKKKGEKEKKNLCAQRLSLPSGGPTARPGFPWVFLCGCQQLERATGGAYASVIQGWGPCLRVPDPAVPSVASALCELRRPSEFTTRTVPTAPLPSGPLAVERY
ncbi:hypothetical protein V8C42DRAFT_2382 [Trichoderma barbatum]